MLPTTPASAQSEGLSRSGFYRAVHAGQYERIARGIYVPADGAAADWDLIEAATRRPEATICLTSALAHYDLTDAIPTSLDIAILRGSRAPATNAAISWHHFDVGTFWIGRTEMTIPGTDSAIGIYSAERTVADAYRLRSRIGYEIARDALSEWLRRGGKPAQLMRVASQLPRTTAPLLRALEHLS